MCALVLYLALLQLYAVTNTYVPLYERNSLFLTLVGNYILEKCKRFLSTVVSDCTLQMLTCDFNKERVRLDAVRHWNSHETLRFQY